MPSAVQAAEEAPCRPAALSAQEHPEDEAKAAGTAPAQHAAARQARRRTGTRPAVGVPCGPTCGDPRPLPASAARRRCRGTAAAAPAEAEMPRGPPGAGLRSHVGPIAIFRWDRRAPRAGCPHRWEEAPGGRHAHLVHARRRAAWAGRFFRAAPCGARAAAPGGFRAGNRGEPPPASPAGAPASARVWAPAAFRRVTAAARAGLASAQPAPARTAAAAKEGAEASPRPALEPVRAVAPLIVPPVAPVLRAVRCGEGRDRPELGPAPHRPRHARCCSRRARRSVRRS
jgi:hypothetical protein